MVDQRLKMDQTVKKKSEESDESDKTDKRIALVFTELLMKFTSHLIKDGRPFQKNGLILLDCLFNSIRILSMQAKKIKDGNDRKAMFFP